jgi:hypothetical protein
MQEVAIKPNLIKKQAESYARVYLDREYGVGGVGQMKTRVQAFFEVLEAA